ncbi:MULTISPECIES: tRNA lysidine(34) synthetase TilS [unclassified Ruegeria]|uniref:tRNA lysidine(34) synthetase TilS n=1 Tax=unclassified Ruegeria TaxID=2625375 RepID=UPI001AE7CE9A|nr:MULTISPECIES: tRNA lysidine(34) synthetase TilS [unclassified Ruegeria]
MYLNHHSGKLLADLRARLPETLPRKLGIAVSGGGDSVALMQLLHQVAQDEAITLFVTTVDHGLRPESAREAETVSRQAAALGMSHDTLRWSGWDGTGNLQDRARQARYDLLSEWAKGRGIDAIALGHTADDQAETLLMRLGRSSGVTGLSGMSAIRKQQGLTLLRPMLGITREQLRTYLTETGVAWVDDPSNQDASFDRIKAREALGGLEPLGIDALSLSRVADNLAQAHTALGVCAQESARSVAQVDQSDVRVNRAGFAALPLEIRRRVLLGILSWIAGSGYPPRQAAVDRAMDAVANGQPASVGGCLIVPQGGSVWICREFNAVKSQMAAPGAVWDGKWRVSGPATMGAEIRALGGEGLQQVPEWRATGRPRIALTATPAVWNADRVLAAPLAGLANGWQARLASDWPEFHASFLSH